MIKAPSPNFSLNLPYQLQVTSNIWWYSCSKILLATIVIIKTTSYWHHVRQSDVNLNSGRRTWCQYDVVLTLDQLNRKWNMLNDINLHIFVVMSIKKCRRENMKQLISLFHFSTKSEKSFFEWHIIFELLSNSSNWLINLISCL